MKKRPKSPPLPPLGIDALQKVDLAERYVAQQMRECRTGVTLNLPKALRMLRTCALTSFQVQMLDYSNRDGFCKAWIDEVQLNTVVSLIGIVQSDGVLLMPFEHERIHDELQAAINDYRSGLRPQVAPGTSTSDPHKTQPQSLSNRDRVEGFLREATKVAPRRMQKQDFWAVAKYGDRTEFQRFQRNDPRTTKRATAAFEGVLKMSPDSFVAAATGKK